MKRHVKFCMDCRFFHGDVSRGDREFLLSLLRSYTIKRILKKWALQGHVKKPSGKGGYPDPDKTRAVQILRQTESFCPRNASTFTL